MKVYSISFMLRDRNKSYMELYDAIKQLGDHFHPLEHTWYIKTDTLTAEDIHNTLMPLINQKQDVFIVNLIDPTDVAGWCFKSYWQYIKNEK